jgi:hypothetical protein
MQRAPKSREHVPRGDSCTDTAEQSILQNESILPAQFFYGSADGARIEPLRRLAFAVLIDAIHCFQSNFESRKPRAMRRFAEAREWLLGPPGDGPFGFANVCYLVDVDGARLRRALRQWQEMKRAGLPQLEVGGGPGPKGFGLSLLWAPRYKDASEASRYNCCHPVRALDAASRAPSIAAGTKAPRG